MKKQIFSFLVVLTISSLVFGQEKERKEKETESNVVTSLNQDQMIHFLSATPRGGRLYTFQQAIPEIGGNPYLYETPATGMIVLNDSMSTQVLLRYNIYKDCIEYNLKGKLVNLYAHKIREFRIFDHSIGKNRIFRNGFKNYLNNYSPLSYYEIAYDNQVKLLIKHDKPIIRVNSQINVPGVNTNSATKQYQPIQRIYLQIDNTFILIKFNKRTIKKALNSSKVNSFLKTSKNNCKSVAEVIEVLEFYEKEVMNTDE